MPDWFFELNLWKKIHKNIFETVENIRNEITVIDVELGDALLVNTSLSERNQEELKILISKIRAFIEKKIQILKHNL